METIPTTSSALLSVKDYGCKICGSGSVLATGDLCYKVGWTGGSGELRAVDLLDPGKSPAPRLFGGQTDASSLPASEMLQCDRDTCYFWAVLHVPREAEDSSVGTGQLLLRGPGRKLCVPSAWDVLCKEEAFITKSRSASGSFTRVVTTWCWGNWLNLAIRVPWRNKKGNRWRELDWSECGQGGRQEKWLPPGQ